MSINFNEALKSYSVLEKKDHAAKTEFMDGVSSSSSDEPMDFASVLATMKKTDVLSAAQKLLIHGNKKTVQSVLDEMK